MELKEALSKLDEQRNIAEFLREQQITGVLGSAESCVISNYLHQTVGVRYTVTDAFIAELEPSGECVEMVFRDSIPDRVKELIAEFDNGEHPELVELEGRDPALFDYEAMETGPQIAP